MSTKVTTINTNPPVDVKVWETRRKYFWAFNYPGNSKNGPFKSEKLALLDATQFSSDSLQQLCGCYLTYSTHIIFTNC